MDYMIMPQASDMRQEILPHRLVAEQQQPPPELAILNFAGQRGRWPFYENNAWRFHLEGRRPRRPGQ